MKTMQRFIPVNCPACGTWSDAKEIHAQADRKGERKALGWQAYCRPCDCSFSVEVKDFEREAAAGFDRRCREMGAY